MSSNQRHPVMARNFQDDLYIVWQEGRYGDGLEKLFMQCITPSGRKIWDRSGLMVCNYLGRQSSPSILSDNYGYFWVSWLDERNKEIEGSMLFSKKFEIGGENEWTSTGVLVGSGLKEFGEYEMVLNKGGYLVLAWIESEEDSSQKAQLRVQKLRPNGEKVFGALGEAVSRGEREQYSPAISVSMGGEIILIFAERGGKTGIKAVPLR